MDRGIGRNFTNEFTRSMSVATIGTGRVAAGVASKTIVAGTFTGFAVADTIGRTFGVVMGLVVAVGNVTPSASKKTDTFGAIKGLVAGVARTKVVFAARPFAGTLEKKWGVGVGQK